jgi:NAD(P)-dependent dehydrogenase (short-subunit alcohol dehydrogenase family)
MQHIFNVNVFGPIRVTQAMLPYFRSQRRGAVAFIGAGVAWAPIAFLAHYSAAKAALDRFVEGLQKELGGQGIHCMVFEPGGFASQLGRPRNEADEGFGQYQPSVQDYAGLFAETMGIFVNEIAPNIPGDVMKLADTIVGLVAAEGMEGKLPVRVVLGSDAVALVKQKCREQLELIDELEHVSRRTKRDDADVCRYEGMLRLTSMLS